ncbi:mannonate dehydratase [Chelatococcus asaccharovorans]|uniref:mannonate dehydratase n=1 Tax=Chelatococcus asaccharovorans TaxID=28210 RepID=A0A2V3TW91_9HYPH|nr:mannonate dehydratase [Chelatococcus asaccharovorans]MBS7706153.1 mannonate dehydratase [Chelatococcus asaccharovorans]PXW52528.1 mannonate dehydratase [Chelatococcus asaccharovorans]
MPLTFRVAVGQFKELIPDDLAFCSQLGVSGITVNRPDFSTPSWRNFLGKHYPYGPADFTKSSKWDFMDLVNLRRRVEDFGLRLESIENVPYHFYDKVLTGAPGRDEQIDNYCETLLNLGRAGIRILGYHFAPNLVWRTSTARPARGRAGVTAFDMDEAHLAPNTHGRVFEEAEMWENYEYFITRVLPAAQEAGVSLALHPDDPPVSALGGVARIMNSLDGFRKALRIGSSPNHGLTFCVGTWGQMGGSVVYDALEEFVGQDRVKYLHVRNIKGSVPSFAECFVDEGDIDIVRILKILQRNSFGGFVIDDHVPQMTHDTPWGHRGRAFSTGYLRGLCRALDSHET